MVGVFNGGCVQWWVCSMVGVFNIIFRNNEHGDLLG